MNSKNLNIDLSVGVSIRCGSKGKVLDKSISLPSDGDDGKQRKPVEFSPFTPVLKPKAKKPVSHSEIRVERIQAKPNQAVKDELISFRSIQQDMPIHYEIEEEAVPIPIQQYEYDEQEQQELNSSFKFSPKSGSPGNRKANRTTECDQYYTDRIEEGIQPIRQDGKIYNKKTGKPIGADYLFKSRTLPMEESVKTFGEEYKPVEPTFQADRLKKRWHTKILEKFAEQPDVDQAVDLEDDQQNASKIVQNLSRLSGKLKHESSMLDMESPVSMRGRTADNIEDTEDGDADEEDLQEIEETGQVQGWTGQPVATGTEYVQDESGRFVERYQFEMDRYQNQSNASSSQNDSSLHIRRFDNVHNRHKDGSSFEITDL